MKKALRYTKPFLRSFSSISMVFIMALGLVPRPVWAQTFTCPAGMSKLDCDAILQGWSSWVPDTSVCGTSSFSSTSTIEQQIAQTFIVGFQANTPKEVITEIATKYRIGGIYPIGTKDAAGAGFDKAFYDSLGKAATIPLIASSDEEGVISRYTYPPGLFPSAASMAKMSDDEVQEVGKKAGQVMALNGLTTDLAPVLDLRDVGIGGRAFSSDPKVVAAKAGAFAAGLQESNIKPMFKHFPGFSKATNPANGNTDIEKVTLKGDITSNISPYREVLQKFPDAAVMLSNLYVEKLDPDNPSGTSKKTVDYLRDDLKFAGLITTDDLAVKSVVGHAGSAGKAVAGALSAGVTMPLFTLPNAGSVESASKEMDAIVSAVRDNKEATAAINAAAPIIQRFKGVNSVGIGSTETASCCASGASFDNGNTEQNTKAVYDYLTSSGRMAAVQAAGVVGNMHTESSVLPQRLQGTGPDVITTAQQFLDSGSGAGWGLVQWTPGTKFITSRDTSSPHTTAHTVEEADQLSTQIGFVWDQLEGRTDIPEKIAGDDLKALASDPALKDDLREAVLAFQGDKKVGGKYFGYERPADQAGSVDERLAYAVKVLEKYGSGAGGGASIQNISLGSSCSSGNGTTGKYSLPLDQSIYDKYPEQFKKPHHDYPAADISRPAVPEGTNVYAAAGGKIVKAPLQPKTEGYGLGVMIDVGDGVVMYYGHGIDGGSIDGAKQDDVVSAGQLIMHSGNTGHSTGPHLHFEIRVDGQKVCPQPFLQAIGEGKTPPDIRSLPKTGCIGPSL